MVFNVIHFFLRIALVNVCVFEQKTVNLLSILQANASLFLDFIYKKLDNNDEIIIVEISRRL